MPATSADVKKIANYIRQKVGHVFGKKPPTLDYYRDFWYDLDLHQGKYQQTPSHRSEVGGDQVIKWFTNNQRFLTEIRDKVVQTADDEEESDGESDSDSDFDY